ncbi:GNAT family N-acetyltransferase [Curtobacterium pusillum]|uniref:GNAT family N-acetyltransferase n=1 Tax=Curtobacterium pusillum TaxID=69373 RepID=A0ABX2MEN8_9MICO|nr:GNAT family protein [Curtobacterium pusillum]NUU15248.1 GNAT family N-acetyltransferase [Curtobacterium pusillum]GLK31420.1 putative acetyltransferase [Curtobacterium pusillum]
MDPVTLRTDRLVLSVPEPADADDVVAYANDPDVIAYTPVPVPYGRAEAHHWITEIVRAGWTAGSRYEFGVRRADDPRLLGTVGLFGFVDGAAEIGYAMHPDGRGQGLMTEAAAAVLEWAFAPFPDGLGLVRVQWRAIAANAPSAAIARRLGLRYEGRLRAGVLHRGRRHDQLIAAALREDDRSDPTVWPTT